MKVLFNIKKLQISKITATDSDGKPTYGSPMQIPGTVSLTMDAESSSDPFYADGVAYYTPTGAETATGTLENAMLPANVLKSVFAYVESTNGELIATDGQVNEFGMQFAVDSDDGEVYFTYYRVSANKPGDNFSTNAPSATINPQSLSLTASTITLADKTTRVIKSFATKDASNYSNYFTAITLPVVAPSV